MNSKAKNHHEWDSSRQVDFLAASALSGRTAKFQVAQTDGDGVILVFSEEYDADVDLDTLRMRTFSDGKSAAAWFKRFGYALSPDILRALRANNVRSCDVPAKPARVQWVRDVAGRACGLVKAVAVRAGLFGRYASV